ncbi:MAG: RibD family protein [Bacteroidales bacterium]|nr:RibD family protein [Bacteroidales bacterium]MCM1146935.1 RibD family protein [Bacteroidales bacterium]MCM1207018.1 RibD family protein [Bacillota bacterium]MCM1511428.1 RibD family protein [Clostridium sp.]
MKRPYIVCHMVASIDGRIDCAMVDKISGDEYYATLEKLDCPTSLEGRVTMEHYNAAKEPFVANNPISFGMSSVYKAVDSDKYIVAVDTHGKLRWPASKIDGVPLVCIVSEQVPQEYLEMLKKEGISYICIGRDTIDLSKAMEILYSEFRVERMAVLGGGHINGGFLAAGLIDEVSLLLAPGIDGRKGQTALFDGITDMERMPVKLSLESVERIENGTLWIRYKTNY